MASRHEAEAKEARDHLRDVVGFSAADELEKLGKLKASGEITADEYARLRATLIQEQISNLRPEACLLALGPYWLPPIPGKSCLFPRKRPEFYRQ